MPNKHLVVRPVTVLHPLEFAEIEEKENEKDKEITETRQKGPIEAAKASAPSISISDEILEQESAEENSGSAENSKKKPEIRRRRKAADKALQRIASWTAALQRGD